jgi:hypothetical protein
MQLIRSVVLLTGLLAAAPALSLAAGRWQTEKPEGVKRALPKGKTLYRSASRDGKYVLLVRDEGEKGDFFWRSVYVQQGGAYTLLRTCNELRRARWRGNPAAVSFEIDAAVGPAEVERSEVVYTPSTRTLRRRVLRTLKVEGAG